MTQFNAQPSCRRGRRSCVVYCPRIKCPSLSSRVASIFNASWKRLKLGLSIGEGVIICLKNLFSWNDKDSLLYWAKADCQTVLGWYPPISSKLIPALQEVHRLPKKKATEHGRRLAALRQQAGRSQVKLARMLDIPQRTLSFYERETEAIPRA